MDIIDRLLDRLSRSLAALSAISLIVVALILIVDVLHRNISGRSIAGAFELVETIVVMIAFLGIMHAERSRTNVRITFVTARMPARLAESARLVGTAVTLMVTGWFTVATWFTAVASTARGEFTQGLVAYPTWPAKLIIAVGFTALTLQIAVDLVVRSLVLSSDRTAAPAPAATPTPTARHV